MIVDCRIQTTKLQLSCNDILETIDVQLTIVTIGKIVDFRIQTSKLSDNVTRRFQCQSMTLMIS